MISLLTLNLRYNNPSDGENSFENRIDIIRDRINLEMPDLIGFQELKDGMLEIMEHIMPEYTFIGVGRDQDLSGERTSIAYRTKYFKLNSHETFWLSNTPDEPGSRFPGQCALPRICTWAMLEYLPDKVSVIHYNTHLDHHNPAIRKLEVEVILKHMAAVKSKHDVPVILSGDFNMTPEEPLYGLLQSGEFPLVDVTSSIDSTFHGFGKEERKKIDYIFTDEKTARMVTSVRKISEEREGVYLSDHDGIRVDLELK